MRTLMTRLVSIMSMYESPKERERSLDQCASRILECSTDGLIAGPDYQPTFLHLTLFNL